VDPRLRSVLQVLGVAAIYFAAAKVALLLAIPPGYATPVWPPAGIALAALMRGGLRVWPGIFLGAAGVNYTVQQSLAAALAIGAGNTLAAVAAALIALRLFGEGRDPFDRPAQVFQLFGIALSAPLIAASIGIGSLWGLGVLPESTVGANWITWWLGDATGILILAPLMLAWTGGAPAEPAAAGPIERTAFIGVTLLICVALYVNWLPGRQPMPLAFLALPALAWAAMRFGVREVATACAAITAVAIWQASQGGGPFAGADLTRALLLLQAFLATLAVTSLALAVAMRSLRRAAADLERARAEVEHFADITAHDLQEPLRNILNFADLLALRSRERLEPDSREFLGYIVQSAARMRRLLEDVLSVTRASRVALRLEACDSGAALGAALANLEALVQESGARIERDALPAVRADPRLVESLFQNLVGNALKFRAEAAPVVRVGARRAGASWVFSVRDNGIGIDPRYHAVIFGMFERLAPRESAAGSTGVGLAICKRIVERHGGRIWVQSAPGEGATFFFTLPAA
jgi:signal transduction histidine kinase